MATIKIARDECNQTLNLNEALDLSEPTVNISVTAAAAAVT